MLSHTIRTSFETAAQAVKVRSEEINRLNVFPVPDGDTGTNMSLTLASVVKELESLSVNASLQEVCQAIIHGSLMGARGNSGVITSQILRGLSEGFAEIEDDELTTKKLAAIFRRSVKVAFQAVRKPVEGTILTVLKDTSSKIDKMDRQKASLEETLEALVAAAYDSVAHTPDFLPVLKENGVVDAGGYGLAIFFEAFVNAALGKESDLSLISSSSMTVEDVINIELDEDWEGSEFTYCTEFLFQAKGINVPEIQYFLSTMGDSELFVGTEPIYKVHVHTDTPDQVLKYMLERGQIFEVHIHNMNLQAQDRIQLLESEKAADGNQAGEHKELGFVAVASGNGNEEILRSLGVDWIVKGGQTMNPSTKDLLEAIESVNADKVIVLPNNKNIILAAQSAVQASNKPGSVVPTSSIPQSFSALFAYDASLDLEDNVELMTEALNVVHDIEITTAVKESTSADGKKIHEGDIIAVIDGRIDVVGSDLKSVALESIKQLQEKIDGITLTVLAGDDLADDLFEEINSSIEEAFEDLELDAHRGGQPLYPLIMSLE
ncbi:MAG: DAK2 domain-containing protein [Coriobacteriia bacterium]|nr:DAK2 domain-containing protein [Coriobacteriia bacterium]